MLTGWHLRGYIMKRTIITVILTLAFTAFAIQAVEQKAFSGAGIVESTTGGFKFPDGTVQTSAVPVSCTAITYLPYVISSEGVYCFTGNLSTDMTSGYAIEIQADNVVVDFNGWKLDGLSGGTSTRARGIHGVYLKNITIRNGTIQGFEYAIAIYGNYPLTISSGHLVEDIRVDQATYVGLSVAGHGSIVRRNQIIDTGTGPVGGAYGITMHGNGVRALDNDIINTQGTSEITTVALSISESSGAVVERNRIDGARNSNTLRAFGIWLGSNADDALVVANRITDADVGIEYNHSASGKYRDNLTFNVTTPYGLGGYGTDAGGNN
jgi:hypothetical protein